MSCLIGLDINYFCKSKVIFPKNWSMKLITTGIKQEIMENLSFSNLLTITTTQDTIIITYLGNIWTMSLGYKGS